jgi:TP901 family phage tail tape measure protein
MADSEANIRIDIDTSSALASIKNLQRQISVFHQQMLTSGNAANAALSKNMQKGLVDSINASGKFSANLTNIKSTTESFSAALESNKLSMGEYFRYAGASTKTFGRLFKSEFDTIDKVSRERVKTLQTQYIKMGRDANGSLQAIKVRPLALDMQNLGTQTAMAAQKQQLFNQLIKQGSTNLLNWGKNTQWAGRQLMVGFTIPLAMMGAAAAKSFEQIEKQAIRFKRVYGDAFSSSAETDKALENMKTLAEEFTKYGIAVEKTLELSADAAQMGLKGAELQAQVAQATRLAALGEVEQQEALKTTISVTNAFGIAASDLAKEIDFLNAVENETVTAIEDLTIAIPKAGPVVKQLGGDVRDLAFFLTAMKEGGINASEGANALKSGLASMINPAQKTKDMLQGLGISIDSIVESNAGNIRGTVIGMAKALDELDPLSRARAIEQLFGKFQFSRISTLFQNVVKEGSQASKVLGLASSSAEELAIIAERELKRVEDSPLFKFQKQVESLKAALAPIGEEFLKLVTPILEFGTSLLKQFNNMSDGSKTFVTGLIALLGLIAPAALMTVGLVANGVANLLKGFNALRLFYQRLSGSSTQLGAATQYMTQEQLEAAAVAASLNQSHATLIQTFTSESAALSKLIAVYQAATKAQLAMNAAAAGKRIAVAPPINRIAGGRRAQSPQGKIEGVPGYARGVLSVPGPKGAGDVVPAMLSPGEAVIPAKQSKKYSGIISSLISDNIPGFRFGRNPFASMLERSQVAVRMGSSSFLSALMMGGKNARYKSAFETGTGADYLNRSGSINERQKLARSAMERDLFGLDPKTTLASARPTYGYARTPILQSLINNIFGLKGKNFNAITAGPRGKSMDRYGDIDLVTKSSVAKRSSAYLGDSLVDYVRTAESRTRRSPNFNNPIPQKDMQMPLASMRGATPEQLKYFERLRSPFGSNQRPGETSYWTNPKNPYIETQTPGGFSFKEIDKVIARDPAIARQIRAELKAAGLGGIKVSGGGFLERLLGRMGVQGYRSGTSSVSKGNSRGLFTGYATGINSAAFAFTDNDQKIFRSLKLDNLSQKRYGEYLQHRFSEGRNYRTVPASLDMFASNRQSDVGREILARLARANVDKKTAASIMSDAAKMSKTRDAAEKALTSVTNGILETTKPNGKADSSALKRSIREQLGISAFRIKKEFAHVGPGGQITAKEALRLIDEGKLTGLKASQIASIKTANPLSIIDVKSGLGFDIENTEKDKSGKQIRLNAKMVGTGASISELIKEFKRSGADKWSSSIRFGGGDPSKLSAQTATFDKKLIENLDKYPKDTVVVDSEAKAKQLIGKGLKAVSMERVYSITQQQVAGATRDLQNVLKLAEATPTELRSAGIKGLKSPGGSRAAIGSPLQALMGQMAPFQRLFSRGFPLKFAKGTNSVPGYARGVLSVPGPKGAGDVVPAMLSPGEAVIPARMSRKYAPLINSMISDNVPGYNTGKLAPPTFDDDPLGTSRNRAAGVTPSERKKFGTSIGAGFGKSKEVTKALASSTTRVLKNVVVGSMEENRGVLGRLGRAAAIGLGNIGGNPVVNASGKVVNSPTGVEKSIAAAQPGQSRGSSTAIGQAGVNESSSKNKGPGDAQRGPGGKFAAATTIAGMGAMMYGMSGGPGADIASMAAFPLMMLPMILPMLANKFGLATVAIGALVAGIIVLNNKLKDATKSGLEAGKAMSMTNEKLEGIAEFTGKVTASQIADRKRENLLTGEGEKKRQFGQTFMGSDTGQALLADAEAMIKSGMTSDVASNIANQLSYSIMQGVLTPDQARSIAAGLGLELQNYSIGISVAGKLTQLFGANGENLLNGDPLQISLAIQKDSLKQQTTAFENSLSVISENSKNDAITSGAAIASAALTVAAAATVIGATLSPATAGISGIIGGIVAAGSGIVAGVAGLMEIGDEEENNKARGVAVQLGAEQLAQNQGLVDSIQRQYDAQIAQLEIEKNSAKDKKERLVIEQKINDKIAEREAGIKAQKETNAEIFSLLVNQAKTLGSGFTSAIGLAIDERFKDATGAVKAAAELAKSSLSELTDGDFKIGLQIGLASGEFDPITVSNLINADKDSNGQIGLSYNLLVGARGTADANTFIQLLGAANVGTEKYKVMLDFIIADKEDFDNNMEALSQIASMPVEYGFKVTATTELINEAGDFIRETSDLPETVTQDIIVNYIRNTPNLSSTTVETLQGMLDNWEVLTNGTNKLNYQVLVDFLIGKSNPLAIEALFAARNPERYKEMLGTMDGTEIIGQTLFGGQLVGGPTGKSRISDAERDEMAAEILGQGSAKGDDVVTPKGSPASGSGTAKRTWIDDVLKKLKNLTDASINARGGLKELKRVIDGTKLNIFDGLGQKFSKAGISEAFADELMDMGKKARRKFVTIAKDGTAILTEAGKRRERAYQRITLGQFNLDQVRVLQSTKEQTTAVNKLTSAGLSLAEAYEVVQDKALAAAIAGKQLSKTALTSLIADIKAATAATKEFQNVSSVRISAEEANNIVKAAKQLDKSTYSFAEQQAILSDSALTELFLSGRNQQLLKARIKQILTPEFLQGIFDEGFNAAINAFVVKEKKIELDFEAKIKPDMSIIDAAQNQIAGIEYIVDDLQAELRDIEDQEEKINESYDERIKALDKIREANTKLANQQKGQLAVADALSKGDIAAAAKAIQELRASEAQDNLAKQRSALDLSREKDLARLTSKNGKTRKKLEEEIKKLQNDIFQIEEDRLEPAQRRIQLAEIERDDLIDSVTVLGNTRLAWNQIENSIDQARIGSARYTQSITDAIGMVNNLKTAWEGATPGGTEVEIPAAESMGTPSVAAPGANPRHIPGDAKFNQMVDLYRAMDAENKDRFKNMVGVGPGTDFATWKAKRLSGAISNGNLDRSIAYMKNGIISKAEIADELSRPFSFNKNLGGKIQKYSMGSIVPGIGSTDKVPGLLTPGEFVVRKAATKAYLPQLKAMNSGLFPRLNAPSYGLSSPSLSLAQRSASKSGQTMYNNTYSIDVNVSTDANPNEIARAVMTQIKQIDSQRIRGNRF